MSDLEKEVIDEKVEDSKQTPEYTEDETIALARGWKPKDEWDGPEDEWKPAKVFNQIGELKEKLQAKDADNKKLNKVVQLMKQHHLQVRQSAYEQAVKDLKAQREAALESEDLIKAERIKDQIDDIKDRFRADDALPAHVEKEIASSTNEPDPELFAFMDRNPWYKPNSTDPMSKKADALGWAYKNEDPSLSFKEIIKLVESDIRKLFPDKFSTPRNPVNEPGSRAAPSKSESRVSLTEEQRAVARSFGMTDAEYAKELKSYKGG
jgi:hypothetical protein